MAIVQCSRMHYYDNEKFSECPHCAKKGGAGGMDDESVTVALESKQVENYAVEYVMQNAPAQKISIPVIAGRGTLPPQKAQPDEERTVSIYEKKGIAGYTAGWLVCVEGENYGQDFPLYAGFNRVGRSHGSDVSLKDPQVSREEHCSVIYEEKKNVFYVVPSAGSLTYLDEELVERAQEMKSGQILTLGETRLEFAAFCTGEKRWKKRN